jgi:tRNA (guanine-N7-)-methyltransferase
MPDHPPLRTFGRMKARPLKPRQQALVEELLPHLAVPAEGVIEIEALFSPSPRGEGAGGGVNLISSSITPPPNLLPSRGGGVVLEIGFGGGEHLVAQAQAHPEQRFIGAEPFLNGVGSCLRHIEESGVQNVRLHHGDARDVLTRLPDAALDRCYILFPDPWPKARHHKRRLIQRDFLAELARVLKPGAEVRFATDWANYAEWTLEMFHKEPRFSWLAERADDWRQAWEGHVPTRYEQKRLGDCAPIWLRFARR